jgi:hypothetical protein
MLYTHSDRYCSIQFKFLPGLIRRNKRQIPDISFDSNVDYQMIPEVNKNFNNILLDNDINTYPKIMSYTKYCVVL